MCYASSRKGILEGRNSMKTHHRITLVLREEPEGHGTLLVETERGLRRSPHTEALELIHRQDMADERYSLDFTKCLADAISKNKDSIADIFAQATIQGTLEPVEHEKATEAVDSISAIRATTLMQFLAWLEDVGHSIGDYESNQDILNLFAKAKQDEFPTYAEILNHFATWIDQHSTWRMSKLHDQLVESRAVAAVEAYLDVVAQNDGKWDV